MPASPAHAALLHNGRALFFMEETGGPSYGVWWKWNYDNETTLDDTAGYSPLTNSFCSGHAFLSDGRLFVAGGGGAFPGDPYSDQAWIFDPTVTNPTSPWTYAGTMAYRRYYATVLSLGYPYMLVAGGWTNDGDKDFVADEFEIFNETADPSEAFREVIGSERQLVEAYPGLHLLPNGRIMMTRTGFCHGWPSCNDTDTTASYFQFGDLAEPTKGEWFEVASDMPHPDRSEGMSVQWLGRDKTSENGYSAALAVFGGGEPDESGADTVVRLDPAMSSWQILDGDMAGDGRIHAISVLLPDGNTLSFGGAEDVDDGTGGNKTSELYLGNAIPVQMQDLHRSRGYHGVALLLPNGKVAVSGGAYFNDNEKTIEIFYPPYLFLGSRPSITSAPSVVDHGETFNVGFSLADANTVAKVTLVRPMSMTHQTDTEQRVLELPFTKINSTTLSVTATGGTAPHPHAPAGYYMLFLVDTKGSPSVGSWVKLNP
jgi:hypothetical protein